MSVLCPAKMYVTEIGNSHVSTNSVCPRKAQSQIGHIVGFFSGWQGHTWQCSGLLLTLCSGITPVGLRALYGMPGQSQYASFPYLGHIHVTKQS